MQVQVSDGYYSCILQPLTRLMAASSCRATVVDAESSKKRKKSKTAYQGSSKLRRNARREFADALLRSRGEFSNPENLPSLEAAYGEFLDMFPRFVDTSEVDQVRAVEYAHLSDRVCLDYSGFGLFSQLQRTVNPESSSFRLAYVSANLPTHALYGAAEEGTMEAYIRKRIMSYLRINENDYSMVFTSSKSSAVKLLAESYRFDINERLLVTYDHHSQSIEWMMQCARERGAKVASGVFQWPSLKICSRDLKKQLQAEKKSRKDGVKGLFVFPPQSRVTGVKYSYQWIALAQQNHWHVLLDASAIGPRDMDALGLSVFSPDFIVSSFYKVFGADPTGFGCLFIKKSAVQCLCNSSKARAVGMVKILPWSMTPEQRETAGKYLSGHDPSTMSSFSGPLSADEYKSTEDVSILMQANFNANLSETESSPDSSEACIQGETVQVDIKGKGKMPDEDVAGPSYSKHELDCVEEEIKDEHSAVTTKIYTLKQLLALSDDDLQIPPVRQASAAPSSHNSAEMPSSSTICCKALDQNRFMGMSKLRNRLWYLVNWLVISLSRFRHPSGSRTPLVQVYGPRKKYDRGAFVAFNLFDWTGQLLEPALVQKLADRNSVSLGLGVVKNVEFVEVFQEVSPKRSSPASWKSATSSMGGEKLELVVITISLGFVTGFEDVYRLWVFIAKFLDADFVQKEAWRYQSLNQELVKI